MNLSTVSATSAECCCNGNSPADASKMDTGDRLWRARCAD
jgi:hypothetical protein